MKNKTKANAYIGKLGGTKVYVIRTNKELIEHYTQLIGIFHETFRVNVESENIEKIRIAMKETEGEMLRRMMK